jgi:hypothetical protein
MSANDKNEEKWCEEAKDSWIRKLGMIGLYDHITSDCYLGGFLAAKKSAQKEHDEIMFITKSFHDAQILSLKAQLKEKDGEIDKLQYLNTKYYGDILQLTSQLEKAEKVIRFYANCEQWITDRVGVPRFCKLDEDIEQIRSQFFAGKRAREYFKNKEQA